MVKFKRRLLVTHPLAIVGFLCRSVMIKEKLFVIRQGLLLKVSRNDLVLIILIHILPIMDAMSFCWLIHFTIQRSLHMCLMDVVIGYLYGDLDKDIHLKNFATLCSLENFAIQRSSYVSHFMDLNKPIVCGINIFLNIFFLMDLRMMIFVLVYLSSIISKNLSSSLFMLMISILLEHPMLLKMLLLCFAANLK